MSARTALDFYVTAPHECSYLPSREAVTLFVDPEMPVDTRLYGVLADHGFRRSGKNVYRPQCRGCNACIAVRVPTNLFRPSRSQRRVWRRNQDVVVTRAPALFDPLQFDLYLRYIQSRHRGGSMDSPDPARFTEFLVSPHVDTAFYELRIGERLVGVAVVDLLVNGLSAVYTFFDPEHSERSLGVFAVLWQIEEAKRRGLPWVYLGFWIPTCRKMSYKDRYRPFEAYRNGKWIDGETVDRSEITGA